MRITSLMIIGAGFWIGSLNNEASASEPSVENALICDAELPSHEIKQFKISFEKISTVAARSGIFKSEILSSVGFSIDGKQKHFAKIPGTLYYGYSSGRLINWALVLEKDRQMIVGASSTNYDANNPHVMGTAGLRVEKSSGPFKLKHCKPSRNF